MGEPIKFVPRSQATRRQSTPGAAQREVNAVFADVTQEQLSAIPADQAAAFQIKVPMKLGTEASLKAKARRMVVRAIDTHGLRGVTVSIALGEVREVDETSVKDGVTSTKVVYAADDFVAYVWPKRAKQQDPAPSSEPTDG